MQDDEEGQIEKLEEDFDKRRIREEMKQAAERKK